MIEDTTKTIFSIVNEFTLKKLFALVLLISIIVIGLVMFDRYTATTKLNKLERIVDLISEVSDLQANEDIQNDPQLLRSLDWIKSELIDLTLDDHEEVSSEDGLYLAWIWRIMLGGLAWYLFSIAMLFSNKKDKKPSSSEWTGFVGVLIFAIGQGLAIHWITPTSASATLIAMMSFTPLIALVIVFMIVGVLASRSRKVAKQIEDGVEES